MSRHRSSGSNSHHIARLRAGEYRVSWAVDRYYPDSRLRHPRGCSRDTDLAGALKFAKRHNIQFPWKSGDWYPITTAPKDETNVQVCGPFSTHRYRADTGRHEPRMEDGVAIGFARFVHGMWQGDGIVYSPTHWSPAPEVPEIYRCAQVHVF